MNIIITKISDIKPNPNNPRVIRDDKFEKLKQSIKEFPEMLEKRPLVCFTDSDKKYVVLGGNMRLKASKELGLKTLPIILADDWTEDQKKEFLIKDNVGFGEWNWDELKSDWDSVKLEEWGLDLPLDTNQMDQKDKSDQISEAFKLEITCSSEEDQEKLFNQFTKKGYECRILTL